MTTDNYYFLTNKDYPELASAFAPDDTKLAHELIPELVAADKLPFELRLVKLFYLKQLVLRLIKILINYYRVKMYG